MWEHFCCKVGAEATTLFAVASVALNTVLRQDYNFVDLIFMQISWFLSKHRFEVVYFKLPLGTSNCLRLLKKIVVAKQAIIIMAIVTGMDICAKSQFTPVT